MGGGEGSGNWREGYEVQEGKEQEARVLRGRQVGETQNLCLGYKKQDYFWANLR